MELLGTANRYFGVYSKYNERFGIQGGVIEHFVGGKTLFVLKRYEIANASIMPTHELTSVLIILVAQAQHTVLIKVKKHHLSSVFFIGVAV